LVLLVGLQALLWYVYVNMTIIYDIYTFVVRMTPSQCRAARELLCWTPEDLARAASVGVFTIRNFETEKSVPEPDMLTSMQRAFEGAGIRFDPSDDGRSGVSLANQGP
jgi:DNA-binding XRE family transcriptional regulator